MGIYNHNNFKKRPESYWLASTSDTDYPTLHQDIEVDLAIIGGGLVGISCAYLLGKEGLKIAVIEASRICKGTTAHTTAKITSQHGLIYNKIQSNLGNELAQQYAEANEFAIGEIRRIIQINGIDCDYIAQPAFIYTQDEKYMEKIRNEVKVTSDLGIKASYVNNLPLPIDIKAGIKFDNQAQFHPRKYILGLAANIHNDDVKIFENTRVVDIEEDRNYILTTDKGKKVRSKNVIIASHYPFYNKHGGYFTRLYPEKSYIVGIKAKEKYPGGMYINAEDPARSLRHQNTDDGELILVVGEHHKTGQSENTNKHYRALLDFANTLFTIEDISYRWSTQDCMTLDGVPYVGNFTTNTPNLYVATGFGKWGMTNSMVSAIVLRDLIVEGQSPWQDVYNPSRKTIIASAKNFLVQNFNVAEQLIEGKLESLPKNIDIEPGEGKILKIDGKRIGVFQDEEGTLHIINTTCTHMGCELNWNSAERSWDCPCHGSRFTYKGDIIEGPAVEPLKTDKDVNTIQKLFKDDF